MGDHIALLRKSPRVMLHRAVGEHGGGDHPGRAVQPARGRARLRLSPGRGRDARAIDRSSCRVCSCARSWRMARVVRSWEAVAQNAWPFQWRQERKRSFLKKRTKRLLIPAPCGNLSGHGPAPLCRRKRSKSFCFFFFRKRRRSGFLLRMRKKPRQNPALRSSSAHCPVPARRPSSS